VIILSAAFSGLLCFATLLVLLLLSPTYCSDLFPRFLFPVLFFFIYFFRRACEERPRVLSAPTPTPFGRGEQRIRRPSMTY
jgi:hypothetical protein